ncbi:hypothetical protein JT358_13565 [Micrococcales bacterium 31B]|nr:hypothetical protein [Micrococcales bacterium 31B]
MNTITNHNNFRAAGNALLITAAFAIGMQRLGLPWWAWALQFAFTFLAARLFLSQYTVVGADGATKTLDKKKLLKSALINAVILGALAFVWFFWL